MKKLMILLLGGVIIALLSYFCFLDKAKRIQDKLVSNVQKSYEKNDMKWVKATAIDSKFGPTRNIKLTGDAPTDELKQKAQKLALMQNGIHNVHNQLIVSKATKLAVNNDNNITVKVDKNSTSKNILTAKKTTSPTLTTKNSEISTIYPYEINIQKDRDSKVTINGLVPNTKTHNDIISYAKELYGSSNVIDELREENGAPDMWASNIKKGLLELKDTAYGTFEISQFKYKLKAYVDDIDIKNSLLKKYESNLHSGVLASFEINTTKKKGIMDRMLDKADEILAKAEEKAKNSLKVISFETNEDKNISKKSITQKDKTKVAISCQDELKKILSQNKIHFQYNKAKIDTDSYKLLDTLANIMKKCPDDKAIVISGHTDSTGSQQYNLTLSTNRAKAVKEYINKKGISSKRVVAVGYGESKPIADNNTESSRAKNRRIELDIIDIKEVANIKTPKINISTKDINKHKKIAPLSGEKAFKYCQTQFNYLVSKEKIHFSNDRRRISKKSYKFVDALSYVAKKCPNTQITIEAHTDAIGSKEENLKLSQIKANTVKNYMVKKGVNKNQLKTIGYGESKPIADNATPAGRSKNRRIEFKLGRSK